MMRIINIVIDNTCLPESNKKDVICGIPRGVATNEEDYEIV